MTFCIFRLFPRSEAAIVCSVTKKKQDDAEKYLSGPLFRGLNNLLNPSVCEVISEMICNPMDDNSQSSYVHGILQARILVWVAISFSRGSSQPRDRTLVS